MKMKRIDRTDFENDMVYNMLSKSSICQLNPNISKNHFSSIPTVYYNQQNCIKTRKIMKFQESSNCSILSLFRTHDLNMSIPTCNGSNIQQMMSSLSKMDEVICPAACIEENIETSISFTIQSDKMFEKTLKTWKLPTGLTKEDSVTMDLYFTSLMTDVGL
jgi:hypothetical protein